VDCRPQDGGILGQVGLRQGGHHAAGAGPGDLQADLVPQADGGAHPPLFDEALLPGPAGHDDVGAEAPDLEPAGRVEFAQPVRAWRWSGGDTVARSKKVPRGMASSVTASRWASPSRSGPVFLQHGGVRGRSGQRHRPAQDGGKDLIPILFVAGERGAVGKCEAQRGQGAGAPDGFREGGRGEGRKGGAICGGSWHWLPCPWRASTRAKARSPRRPRSATSAAFSSSPCMDFDRG